MNLNQLLITNRFYHLSHSKSFFEILPFLFIIRSVILSLFSSNWSTRVPNKPDGGEKFTRLENDIDIGGRVKEMCPKHKGHWYLMSRGSNRNTVGFGENWVRGTRHIFGTWSFIFWSQNVKKILTSHGNWQIKYLLKMQHAYHLATSEAQTATCLLNCNMLTTQPTGEA